MSRFSAVGAALLLCLAGCDRWTPPTNLRDRVADGLPAATSAEPPAQRAGSRWGDGPVTPAVALEMAWADHPAMRMRRSEIGIRHGWGIQADLWPNPNASTELLDEPDRKQAAMVMLAQKFELGGKRDARVSAAGAEVFLAEATLRQTWADVRANVKESLLRLAYLRRRHAVLKQRADDEARRLELSAGLLAAGRATETRHLGVEQSAARAAAAVRAEAAMLADARRQVFAAVGGTDAAAAGEAPEVACSMATDSPTAERFPGVLALARKNSPALAAAQARGTIARAQLRLARARAWSDLTIGGGYKHTDYRSGDNTHTATVALSIDLPIWDRRQGDVKAARAGIDAADAADALAALDVSAAVSDLWAAYQAAGERTRSLKEKVLPVADRRVKLATQAEAAGKVSHLEVLARRREADGVRIDLLNQELLLGIAVIQLERLTVAMPTDAE